MASQQHDGPQRPLYMRLLWFVALWLGGVLVLGAVALLLRRLIL
jgi:ABC-type protease/lipase transport system fused ATPase/permease subunit